MSSHNFYSISSTIQFNFESTPLRDYSYKAYQPELDIFETDRSNVVMNKKGSHILEFRIESKDITAFRATINDVVSFGKILEGVSFLRENYTNLQ